MPSDLAVYLAGGALAPGANPFGRTIANRELYRALAQHGGFAKLDFVTQDDASRDGTRAALKAMSGVWSWLCAIKSSIPIGGYPIYYTP